MSERPYPSVPYSERSSSDTDWFHTEIEEEIESAAVRHDVAAGAVVRVLERYIPEGDCPADSIDRAAREAFANRWSEYTN